MLLTLINFTHEPGLVDITCCSMDIVPVFCSPGPDEVKIWSTNFVLSVLPDPDSPDMRMHWFFLVLINSLRAFYATANICGSLHSPALCISRTFALYMSKRFHGFTAIKIGPVYE